MYSESDIDGAVAAGKLSAEAAAALRNFTAQGRHSPAVDEEHFRLLSGFNDIFVSIALVLALTAVYQIGAWISAPLGGVAIAGAAWMLAEYFTRTRRMALPSILLLGAFVGGVAAALAGFLIVLQFHPSARVGAATGAAVALLSAGAAWLHWRRFMVPITVAAGSLALVGTLIGLAISANPVPEAIAFPVAGLGGLAVFGAAMRWDMSDLERRTRRSDVAFWLHLAAAPLIAHPVFHLLGVFSDRVSIVTAVIVLLLYVGFGFVALAVDRRALLVSSLAYVLYALYSLISQAGAIELSASITALVIGSALLTLSVFWHQMRRVVIGMVGGLRDRLPPAQPVVPA